MTSENIKYFRNRKGFTLEELAELCESSASYIGQLEMGIRLPSLSLLEKLSTALDVEIHNFLYDLSKDRATDENKLDKIQNDLTDLIKKVDDLAKK